MKAKELRTLSQDELKEKLAGLRKQYMELQFKRRSGSEKPHLYSATRRDIARILTILGDKK